MKIIPNCHKKFEFLFFSRRDDKLFAIFFFLEQDSELVGQIKSKLEQLERNNEAIKPTIAMSPNLLMERHGRLANNQVLFSGENYLNPMLGCCLCFECSFFQLIRLALCVVQGQLVHGLLM